VASCVRLSKGVYGQATALLNNRCKFEFIFNKYELIFLTAINEEVTED